MRLIGYVIKKSIHTLGALTKKYYFEDFVRVYPNGFRYNRFGFRVKASQEVINNFLNHQKYYHFASQYAPGKSIGDIGCGSGYGCKILKDRSAQKVYGCDLSKHSINYAKKHFSQFAEFSIQGITQLTKYQDNLFDLVTNSEVLEHLKEYGKEALALQEIKRVSKKGALIIVGTPNLESMSDDHGFTFEEIDRLFKRLFKEYMIIENALLPFEDSKKAQWDERVKTNKTGVVISQNINFDETVIPADVDNPQVKKGISPGVLEFGPYKVNTQGLHNTHSWIVLAINNK